MPIGWDFSELDGGATDWAPPPAADPWQALDPWHDDPAPIPETGFWTWVEVDASTVYPVLWTRWLTEEDERVCPECGPLDGTVWEDGGGPSPPLHVGCRCRRAPAFTEWRTRSATAWELRWVDG